MGITRWCPGLGGEAPRGSQWQGIAVPGQLYGRGTIPTGPPASRHGVGCVWGRVMDRPDLLPAGLALPGDTCRGCRVCAKHRCSSSNTKGLRAQRPAFPVLLEIRSRSSSWIPLPPHLSCAGVYCSSRMRTRSIGRRDWLRVSTLSSSPPVHGIINFGSTVSNPLFAFFATPMCHGTGGRLSCWSHGQS